MDAGIGRYILVTVARAGGLGHGPLYLAGP
jgi:hypothetical protein